MKKIPTLFVREATGKRRVTPVLNPEAPPIDDAVATEKMDGTCCLVRAGKLYKRLDWKADRGPAPPRWFHWDMNPEQQSGQGWFPVGDGPEDQYHRRVETFDQPDGTYELVGPAVNGNPHRLEKHELRKHGAVVLVGVPTDFDGLRVYLESVAIEGIVWWRGGEPLAKLKRRDFGFSWPVQR